jgi:MFS family permease
MSPLSSRLYRRLGPRRMLVVALAGIMAISTLFLLVDLTTNLWWIRGIMFVRGVFMSLAFVASQAATFSTISSEETGRASALFNTNRQVAASFGVALLATILSQEMQAHRALGETPQAIQSGELLAFHAAFAASIVFGLLGIFFAFGIHDEDAVTGRAQLSSAG